MDRLGSHLQVYRKSRWPEWVCLADGLYCSVHYRWRAWYINVDQSAVDNIHIYWGMQRVSMIQGNRSTDGTRRCRI